MNYRHNYHAGSFADVFKHIVLIALIQSLLQKEKPFCYLDTHAGAGRYDLSSEAAQKSREFDTGIIQLLKQKHFPEEIESYLAAINAVNAEKKSLPQFYPGSPRIVRYLLRPQDSMILTELHPEEFATLKQEFRQDKQVAVHHQDGYQALKAFLPPSERRGLVFIDPSFEKSEEFKQIITGLKIALERWAAGIYAIWYPIKNRTEVNDFYRGLKTQFSKEILIIEFGIYAEDLPGLTTCGMVIINPPWQLDRKFEKIIPWLWQALSPDKTGNLRIKWLER